MKFWVDLGKWVFQCHDGKFCFSKKSIMEVEKSYCLLSSKHLMNSLKKAKQSFCMPHKDISYHDFFLRCEGKGVGKFLQENRYRPNIEGSILNL